MSLDWMTDAVCTTTDPELFFPEPWDTHAGRRIRALCVTCPVQALCLEYAQRNHFYDGWWGGMSPDERTRMRRAAA